MTQLSDDCFAPGRKRMRAADALALLADHLGNDEKALALCEPFMREIVANFDNEWEMNSSDIEQAVRNISGHAE